MCKINSLYSKMLKKQVALITALLVAFLINIQTSSAEELFIGSKDVGGSIYSYNGDKAMGMIVEAPGDVKVNEMYAHVNQVGSATSIRGVIYQKPVDGGNWTFVAATDEFEISDGWNHLTFPYPVELTSGVTYLLAHICDGTRVLYYTGSGGARVWSGSVSFSDPEVSGSQPIQLCYHYGTWAPFDGSPTIELNRGLVAYFPFNNNADDASGNGNHGFEVGSISYIDGPRGVAAQFDGQSFVEADGENFALEELSISFWFNVYENPPETEAKMYSIVCKQASIYNGDKGNYNYAYTYGKVWGLGDRIARMQFEKCGSNSDYMIQAENGFHPLNEWHHVAVIKKTGSWNYFIDGQLITSSSISAIPCTEDPTTPFLVGGQVTDELHLFKGAVDELRVYNRELTAYEVKELYEGKEMTVVLDVKPGSCDNPVNINSNGVLPVAILGSDSFDVNDIEITSLRMIGVEPLRSSIEDVASIEYCDGSSDGITDLTLKFDTEEIAEAMGNVEDGEDFLLTLTGELEDGTKFQGEDGIIILKKGKAKKGK